MPDTVPIHKTSSVFDQISDMQDRIMHRAYEIFEHNGFTPGRDFENWTQAERELVWKPALELSEKDGQYQLEVAVAGVQPNDIEIEVTPDEIMLRADIQHEHTEQKGIVHICEFQTGRMFRLIQVPKKINPEKVKAEVKDGLLRLTAEIAQEARARKLKPEAA
jgi:HSP20 family protein